MGIETPSFCLFGPNDETTQPNGTNFKKKILLNCPPEEDVILVIVLRIHRVKCGHISGTIHPRPKVLSLLDYSSENDDILFTVLRVHCVKCIRISGTVHLRPKILFLMDGPSQMMEKANCVKSVLASNKLKSGTNLIPIIYVDALV